MKSIQRARIVVVADRDHSLLLAARLRRMQALQVSAVVSLDAARHMCRASATDICVVVFSDGALDAARPAESDAPGCNNGVPALLMADVVTPYVRRFARRLGYYAAVPAAIAPRLLYRHIGAALQGRAARRRRSRMPSGIRLSLAGRSTGARAGLPKPTVH